MHRLPASGASRLPKPKSSSTLSNGVAAHPPRHAPPRSKSPPARLQSPFASSNNNHSSNNKNNNHNHHLPKSNGNNSTNNSNNRSTSGEITALSDKLMHSINDQTKLDERLQLSRRQLQTYQRRVSEYERDIADGVLVRRGAAEEENASLRQMLEQERNERVAVEKDKREIELELENLTAALFEEANKMVREVKKDRELAEKKNEQLRIHLIDTEELLAAQQEQLDQLKTTIQQMQDDRAEFEGRISASSVSTSSLSPQYRDSINHLMESVKYPSNTLDHDRAAELELQPAPPTSFVHLLKPVCRRDTPGFEDFHSMLRVLRGILDNPARPATAGLGRFTSAAQAWSFSSGNNASSGTATPTKFGSNQSSLKPPAQLAPPPFPPPLPPSSSSPLSASPPNQIQRPSSATATMWSPSSLLSSSSPSPSFPSFGYHIPSSSSALTPSRPSTPSNRSEYASAHNTLKETRFFKRIVAEDIEPTLRLDIAPGISWLTRRSVLGSMFDGTLIIEPLPAVAGLQWAQCVLCGENRRTTAAAAGAPGPGPGSAQHSNLRTHGFRTSGSESAQRYALCALCLEKMRSCCELVGYLRLLVDGHVRIDDDEAHEREVWEEIVRLRERMFWAKIGAGVVPAFLLPMLQRHQNDGNDDDDNHDVHERYEDKESAERGKEGE